MILRRLCLILIVGICLWNVPAARGQDASGNDGDLSPRANAGQVVMGLWDDDAGTDLGYLTPQVLGVVLGPSGNTFIASEPGLNTRVNPSPGTQLPAGNLWSDAMAFLLPDGNTSANLFYWNGSDTTGGGDPDFVPVSAGTTLSLTVVRTGQSTTSITADGTANPSVGLHWGQKIDGNILHQHPNTSLQKTSGTPAEGIYLLGLKFYMTDNATAIDPSDLVLLPFEATDGNAANNPSQDAAFYDDALSTAITWAADNYSSFQAVPEPSTFILGGLAGFAGLLFARSKGEEVGITKSSKIAAPRPPRRRPGNAAALTHSRKEPNPMRVWHLTLLCAFSAIYLFIAGCSANKPAAPAKSAGEHMHVHGPHDGELIELGNEEYHAEMVHDNQTVTIYVLDNKHEHAVPISAESITIRMVANDKPIEFKLAAKPQQGDPTGKSSRFESQDQALDLALDDEKAERELIIPIGDKAYQAKFIHFDDEHHHHHEAPGAGGSTNAP